MKDTKYYVHTCQDKWGGYYSTIQVADWNEPEDHKHIGMRELSKREQDDIQGQQYYAEQYNRHDHPMTDSLILRK